MEKSDGEHTEGSGDANDQAIAICELSREVDLVTRSALLELDAGDGVAWLDHVAMVCVWEGEGKRLGESWR
jgi:hypothetical protein